MSRHNPDCRHDHDHDHDGTHQHDHDCLHDHDHDCSHDHDEGGHVLDATSTPHPGALAYNSHGIRFRYPAHWTLSEEPGPLETTITVQSPGTSYLTITAFTDRPEPERVIETVLEAYEQIYDDIDVSDPTMDDDELDEIDQVNPVDSLKQSSETGRRLNSPPTLEIDEEVNKLPFDLEPEVKVTRREVDFVCLDLTSSASLTAFQTDLQTILVVTQGHDIELESTRIVFDSILKSLSCD